MIGALRVGTGTAVAAAATFCNMEVGLQNGSTADHAEQYNDDRNNEQDMNEPTQGVRSHQAQKPHDDQDDSK